MNTVCKTHGGAERRMTGSYAISGDAPNDRSTDRKHAYDVWILEWELFQIR